MALMMQLRFLDERLRICANWTSAARRGAGVHPRAGQAERRFGRGAGPCHEQAGDRGPFTRRISRSGAPRRRLRASGLQPLADASMPTRR